MEKGSIFSFEAEKKEIQHLSIPAKNVCAEMVKQLLVHYTNALRSISTHINFDDSGKEKSS